MAQQAQRDYKTSLKCTKPMSLTRQHVQNRNGEPSAISDNVNKARFSMMNTQQDTIPLFSYFPQTADTAYMLGSAI